MAPLDPSSHRVPDSRFGEITGFDLIEWIGGGAWGEVWRATQRSFGRLVAVKLLAPALTLGDRASDRAAQLAWRFQREIEAAAVQDHPNIVRVFTSGVAEGRPWYAMELIEGLPLDDFATTQKLAARERLELFLKVCAGVQHAHDGGVIHRDLKPANILVGADAQPKILDFGLARFLDDSGLGCTLSLHGQPLGTPMFMAPEQAAGRVNEVGLAADVYALGVNLHRLAADSWPFDEKLPPLQLLTAARDAEPRPPRGLPRDLAAIIVKAMAREKSGRYVRGLQAMLRTLDALHDAEWNEPIDRLRAQSHRAAGSALRACGKLAEAEDEFGKALALSSKPPAANPHLRALLQEDLGDVRRKCARPAEALAIFAEAESHYRRAHDEAPQEGIVSIDLARCLTGEAAARAELLEVRQHMAGIQLRHEERAEAAKSLRAALDQSRSLAREHLNDACWCLLVVEIELKLLDLPQPPPEVPRETQLARIAGHFSRFDALPHTATDAHREKADALRARLADETAK